MTKRVVLLRALASMPADVRRVLKGADPTTPGEWSTSDLLGRLFDTETRFLNQLRTVVSEERPTLPRLQPEEPSPDSDTALEELVDRFQQARRETLTFLEGLSAGDWQRKAVHETLGETSLRFLVQNLVDHDTQALTQLIAPRSSLSEAASTRQSFRNTNPVPNPTPKSEVKNARQRSRKWPRSRRAGD
jgi:ABC-type transporter Mla subunit MlaD